MSECGSERVVSLDGADPMRARTYTQSKSDVVAKADGTFVRRAKRTDRSVNRETDPEKRLAKRRLLASKNRGGSAAQADSSAPLTSLEAEAVLPNKLLFAENLPGTCCSRRVLCCVVARLLNARLARRLQTSVQR
jgi:hypothetical protein